MACSSLSEPWFGGLVTSEYQTVTPAATSAINQIPMSISGDLHTDAEPCLWGLIVCTGRV